MTVHRTGGPAAPAAPRHAKGPELRTLSAEQRSQVEQAGGQAVEVKKGDTLSGIAKRAGVSLQELKAANPELCSPARRNGDLIFPGDQVVVPPNKGWAPSAGRHTGQPAEAAQQTSGPQPEQPTGPSPDVAQFEKVAQGIGQAISAMAQRGAIDPNVGQAIDSYLEQFASSPELQGNEALGALQQQWAALKQQLRPQPAAPAEAQEATRPTLGAGQDTSGGMTLQRASQELAQVLQGAAMNPRGFDQATYDAAKARIDTMRNDPLLKNDAQFQQMAAGALQALAQLRPD